MKIQILVILMLSLGSACRSGDQETKSESKAIPAKVNVSLSGTNPADLIGKMVEIPAGEFEMGANSDQADPDEYPRHKVKVNSFMMDVTEVTNQEFAKFVEETGYVTTAEQDIDWEEMKQQLPPNTPQPDPALLQAGSLVFQPTDGPVPLNNPGYWWAWTTGASWKHPQGPDSHIEGKEYHPVTHISWEDAKAYAEWAGKRLPTEAEWEWAAMGGMANTVYPWGNELDSDNEVHANYWQGDFPYDNRENDGFYLSAPVGTFQPNGYGLYDMSGNVWEWCEDLYHYEYYDAHKPEEVVFNPRGPETSLDPDEPLIPKRVLRGGSFLCNDSYCSGYRVSRRMKGDMKSSYNHTGFRCVKEISE